MSFLIQKNVSLREFTTFKIGGRAGFFASARSETEVIEALQFAKQNNLDVFILGGGSNVLISDEGFDGLVLQIALKGISFFSGKDKTICIEAQAGEDWDEFVALCVEKNLQGVECLSGIPGFTGGTPVQNVGAYGVEVADVVSRVRLFDRRTGEDHWVGPDALGFGYRTSVLKNSSHAVVLEVEFALRADKLSAPLRYGELAAALGAEPGSRADPTRVRAEVLALRGRKGMVLDTPDHDTWSVGSFFTNPVVSPAEFARLSTAVDGPMPNYPAPDGVKLAAAWLVERAGFGRGFPDAEAPARLSTKHALALTNRGTATTADVLALARRVRDGVRTAFGIDLTPEPCLIGCIL